MTDFSQGSIAAEGDSESDTHAVMDCIRRIVHALQVGSRAAQHDVGLSGAQLFVLQTLASKGTMSVNELAVHSRTHQSSVSVVVSRLVETGLVKRSASLVDARRLALSVTPAGRRTLKLTFVTPQQRLIDSLHHLEPAQLAQLRVLLGKVVSLSGMDTARAPMFFEEAKGKRDE